MARMSTSQMEDAINGWVECLNQDKLHELSTYILPSHFRNNTEFTLDTYAKFISEGGVGESLHPYNGVNVAKDTKWRWSIDDMKADHEAQCLWANVVIRGEVTLRPGTVAPEAVRKELILVEHSFFWFYNGKIMRHEFVLDGEGLKAQLSEPCQMTTLDSIGSAPIPPTDDELKLSREEIENTYRRYIAQINARHLDSALSVDFWHSNIVHNGKQVTLDDFRDALERFFSDITNLNSDLRVIIVDEEKQRAHVHIKASGRINGHFVSIKDNITYQFFNGRIMRAWQFLDTADLQRQLSAD
ncbi:hypothetical protein GGR50DRAFT_595408 [Xylaria sp. CBS 124048]|nr:hypothetical protein GGR50DRAFT_595408 [Xylaria sp. CBS 124048]